MKVEEILLFIIISCVANGHSGQQSPYTWICRNERCLRKLKSELTPNQLEVPMDICKLNCNRLGSLWPKPTGYVRIGKQLVSFHPSNITLEQDNPELIMDKVENAFEIFKSYLKHPTSESNQVVQQLKIVLKAVSNTTEITLQTDESYQLRISTEVVNSSVIVVANISGETFFGLRHGLETLSQLIAYNDYEDVLKIVSNVTISDQPIFPYRGIMLDTSRNFYSISQLKRLIDGMSYNKLNMFHWHITDSHSFPMEVTRRPKMVEYGAYSKDKIYFKKDIIELVDYAKQRGVKVIPELEQPSHSGYGYQWGKEDGLGELVVCLETQHWYDFCWEPPCGQLNIVNENVSEIFGDIMTDMLEMFDNDLVHLGGDEVDLRCYNSSSEITGWMLENNVPLDSEGFLQIWGEWQENLLGKLHEMSLLGEETKAILWTSKLTHPDRIERFLDKDKYIIQIWSGSEDPIIPGLLNKGYKTIFSNVDGLYLDCGFQAWIGDGLNWCAPVKGWQTIYDNDPEKMYANLTNRTIAQNAVKNGLILGAETPLWSEQADGNSFESRIWPRGAAHAERVWSHPNTKHSEAVVRMVTNRHRMVERGIMADRLQPEFCLQNEGRCYAQKPVS